MDTSVVLILLSALAMSSGAGPIGDSSDRVVIDVCRTLNQDHQDIGMCCDKARGTYITSGEGPSITYLCCLGYFGDVKKNYMNKITFDLLLYIVKTRAETELLLEAEFIAQCQDDNKTPLTLTNYVDWKSSPQTIEFCRKKV